MLSKFHCQTYSICYGLATSPQSMGNCQNNTQQNPPTEDQRYNGTIHIVRRGSKLYAVKTLIVPSQYELTIMTDLVAARARLRHPNFATVVNYEVDSSGDLCQGAYELQLFFEYFTDDLRQCVIRLKQHRQPISEGWICQLLYSLASCLHYLQERGCYQGDIQACKVFLTVDGKVKLMDSYLAGLGLSNLERVISDPMTACYLSPEQLTILKKGKYSREPEDRSSSEVFSLGMTVMEAMLLGSSMDLYHASQYRLSTDRVRDRKENLRQFYSIQLTDLILSMVEEDKRRRPTFKQIMNHDSLRAEKLKQQKY